LTRSPPCSAGWPERVTRQGRRPKRFGRDHPTNIPVYTYDGQAVTVCPECGSLLPTEVMQPDPDGDPFLSDDTDFDILQIPIPGEIPDEDNPCTPASS
jgi:hypothetical protein